MYRSIFFVDVMKNSFHYQFQLLTFSKSHTHMRIECKNQQAWSLQRSTGAVTNHSGEKSQARVVSVFILFVLYMKQLTIYCDLNIRD